MFYLEAYEPKTRQARPVSRHRDWLGVVRAARTTLGPYEIPTIYRDSERGLEKLDLGEWVRANRLERRRLREFAKSGQKVLFS